MFTGFINSTAGKTVVTKTIGTHPSRDFQDVNLWLNSLTGYGPNKIAVGVFYKDGPLTLTNNYWEVGGGSFDFDFTGLPYDIYMTCDDSDYHYGVVGSGVVINFNINDNITLRRYVNGSLSIEKLEFRSTGTTVDNPAGIDFRFGTGNSYLRNCIFSTSFENYLPSYMHYEMRVPGKTGFVYNNLFYGLGFADISNFGLGTGYVYNNTFYNAFETGAIILDDNLNYFCFNNLIACPTGAGGGAGTIGKQLTLSVSAVVNAFASNNGTHLGDYFSAVISGGNAVTGIMNYNNFVSTGIGQEDFNIINTSPLKNAGLSTGVIWDRISGLGPLFTNDIQLRQRGTQWNIGAYDGGYLINDCPPDFSGFVNPTGTVIYKTIGSNLIRDYSTISDFLSDVYTKVYNSGQTVVGVCYNDSVFNETFPVSTGGNRVDFPRDLYIVSNICDRHYGNVNSGVIIRPTNGLIYKDMLPMSFEYLNFDFSNIDTNVDSGFFTCYKTTNDGNQFVKNCIFQNSSDIFTDSSLIAFDFTFPRGNFPYSNTIFYVYNNLFYNIHSEINTLIRCQRLGTTNNNNIVFFNNTITDISAKTPTQNGVSTLYYGENAVCCNNAFIVDLSNYEGSWYINPIENRGLSSDNKNGFFRNGVAFTGYINTADLWGLPNFTGIGLTGHFIATGYGNEDFNILSGSVLYQSCFPSGGTFPKEGLATGIGSGNYYDIQGFYRGSIWNVGAYERTGIVPSGSGESGGSGVLPIQYDLGCISHVFTSSEYALNCLYNTELISVIHTNSLYTVYMADMMHLNTVFCEYNLYINREYNIDMEMDVEDV